MNTNQEEASSLNSVDVRYEEMTAVYSSQFLLSATNEELLLDCSSGFVSEAGGSRTTLPVHTRLALNWNAARRLAGLLNECVEQHEARKMVESKQHVHPGVGSIPAPPSAKAKLPKIGALHD